MARSPQAETPMADAIVLFGATGDLSARMLLPSTRARTIAARRAVGSLFIDPTMPVRSDMRSVWRGCGEQRGSLARGCPRPVVARDHGSDRCLLSIAHTSPLLTRPIRACTGAREERWSRGPAWTPSGQTGALEGPPLARWAFRFSDHHNRMMCVKA